ncbi:MAG: TonB-dependent receptor [Bacteroidota bacterium]
MMKNVALLLTMIVFHFVGIAQTLQVTDETDKPLEGVTAVYQVEQKDQAVFSDQNGILYLDGIVVGSTLKLYLHGFKRVTKTWSEDLVSIQLSKLEYGLDEVVITAQYEPVPENEAINAIRTISAKEIEKRAAVNLNDVLRNELFFRVGQDNILGSQLSMQGISGENVKIMVDGVPVVGRLNGNIDLTQLNLNNIERIEIVEGPLSVNYGSNALAGTINLITKTGKTNETSVGAEFFTETIGHFNFSGSVNHGWNNSSVSVSGGRNFFDGWNPDDAFFYENRDPVADEGRVQQWKPREQIFADIKYRYNFKKGFIEASGSYFDEIIINRTTPRQPFFEIAFDDEYETFRYNGAINGKYQISENWSTNHVFGYNVYRREKTTFRTDLTGVSQELTPNLASLDTTTFTTALARGSFIGKVAHGLELQFGYEAEIEESDGKRIVDETNRIDNVASFFTAQWKPLESLTIKPGLRVQYNSRYDAPLIPSLNFLYQLPNNIELRASYAKGFRAPGLKELSFFFVDINHNIVGNPDLTEEESDNFQASVTGRSQIGNVELKWSGNAFYNQVYNMIGLAFVDGTEDQFSYFNVAENETIGGRSEINGYLGYFNAGIGFGLIGISNDIEGNSDPNFTYTPEATLRFGVDLSEKGWSANIFFKHYGRQSTLNSISDGSVEERFISAYQNLDITVTKQVNNFLTMEIGGRNLTNVQNVNSTIAGGVHGGGGSRAIGTGATMFARVKVNFIKKR